MDKYETSTNNGQSWVVLPSIQVAWIVGNATWNALKEKVDNGQELTISGMRVRKLRAQVVKVGD